MKNNSIQLTVLFVLLLFMAQIFTPFVVAQAQSGGNETSGNENLSLSANASENTSAKAITDESEKNKLTFVLGTDENLISLENASIDAAVNTTIEVIIYNAIEANSINFSNESVIFLASLDKETVEIINQTINESARVFAYNLSSNISIGNVGDVNITKYWVYGGDEDIKNLIIYMDNRFYGNTTAVDPPKASKKPKIIFLVTGHGIPLEIIYEASKEVEDMINVSVYSCSSPSSPVEYLLPDDVNLSAYAVVVVCGWTYDIPDLPSRLDDAKEHTNVIVMDPFAISPGNVNLSAHPDIHKYWAYGVKENAKRLIIYLGVNFCGLNAVVEPPLSFPDPDRAIYHPDSPIIFENLTEYLEWYGTDDGTHHVYDPENITIGIIFGRYAKKREDTKPQDHLIRTIEGRECNVIAIYGSSRQYNLDEFFIKDSKPIVDVIISTDVLPNFVIERENFKSLNVPVLYGIGAPYRTPTEWEDTREGITPRLIQYAALSEIDGLIEPTVFYARIIDNETTGTKHYEPIDYQTDYITDRAISWAKLRYMNNSDKKVVITHKHDEVGKATLGTSMEMYLDVPASIEKVLHQMQERGYNVGSAPLPNVNNITKLMVENGRNVGEWAPEALDTLVETGDPLLIPESRYLEWFRKLPEDRQEEVIKYWGEPPGDIMVWQNDTGKYIVIPKFQFGNVLIAPHPMREDVAWQLYQPDNKFPSYQGGELPPYHQYIAWYMAMKNEFGADAVVHLGETPFPALAGKQFGLGRYDWNGLLLQDMPNLCSWPLHYICETCKRRGGMVLVSYLSPTLVPSGLHGDLSNLQQKIRLYNQAFDDYLKEEYKKTIINESRNMNLDHALDVNFSALDNTTKFESFVKRLDNYLNEIKVSYMPYGLHILSEPPTNESLVAMVESMFGESFKDDVSVINSSEGVTTKLLTEVVLNDMGPEDAQNKVLGQVSDNITNDLILAIQYKNLVNESVMEVARTLGALEGRYIHPGLHGDLVDHPDILPTGKNLYSFDGRLMPTKEAWNIGVEMAKQQLQLHTTKHNNSYPHKIGVVLWSSELHRHHGVVESEILYFLGVKPVWEKHDRWKDVKLISSDELGRPRIDVVMTTSGSYRDIYGYKFELLEKAVRLAANASDTEYPNYVKENSDSLYQWLKDNGYNDTEARKLSPVRIFTHDIGRFGPGLHEAIPASSMWENEDEVADVYLSATSYMYGADVWGVQSRDIFEHNLDGIEIGIFSCSSEVVGVLDQGVDSYLGGLALAVRSVSGETPDLYITNLRDQNNP
ncbi:MAG: cobaltochelatase subunit CobN, partial [Euryarchaeota archaeon]|nr:cobaltochelatase subunit CobN [Euryarchaeota archaeon]